MIKKAICCMLALLCFAMPAAAIDMPFIPFTYNEWAEPVAGASGYESSTEINGTSLSVGSFMAPTDLSISPDGKVACVLDAGNNRVIVSDGDFEKAKELTSFQTASGETKLSEPTGIFAAQDGIYIADKTNGRVLKCDTDGNVLREYTKPESETFPQESDFLPTKVVADSHGIVYVLCEGIYLGAVMYTQEGEFIGFYGSNKVSGSFAALFNKFIGNFISKEAKSRMEKYVPVEYTNFTIDGEDFIYTCTNTDDNTAMIKKLNASGINIFASQMKDSLGFGDPFPQSINGTLYYSRFVDAAVDQNGYLYALDFTTGKVFVYDTDNNLIFTFGGSGTQMGLFLNPVAVEVKAGRVYVLDKEKAGITVFEQTEFGCLVNQAMLAYNDGRYEEAVEPWNEVLKYNSNYRLAYIGLGKAALEAGDIEKAIDHFEIAHYESGYNDAYSEYRVIRMREQFPLYFGLVVLFIIFVYRKHIPGIKKVGPYLRVRLKIGRKRG